MPVNECQQATAVDRWYWYGYKQPPDAEPYNPEWMNWAWQWATFARRYKHANNK